MKCVYSIIKLFGKTYVLKFDNVDPETGLYNVKELGPPF